MMKQLIHVTATAVLVVSSAANGAEPPPAAQPADAPVQAAPASSTAASQPAASAPAAAPDANRAAPAARPAARGSADRLDLDTTVVTGNRELPKVLYIVPWKKADLGDLPAQPFNTLLDEVLTPVDRDVFRREVTYYGALSAPGGTPPAAGAERPAGTEK
jgi:hypothetical protein